MCALHASKLGEMSHYPDKPEIYYDLKCPGSSTLGGGIRHDNLSINQSVNHEALSSIANFKVRQSLNIRRVYD